MDTETTEQRNKQEDKQNLQEKVKELQATVNLLKTDIQTLKRKNTSQKIEYNKKEITFKVLNYFIKSISSIYIYILLGDEYQELYKKIENFLNVDPFEQHKNFTQFEKVLSDYPDITKKKTIHDIFLYKNQQIKYQIQTCIAKNLPKFKKFLQSKNCTLLDFYLLKGYDENTNWNQIFNTLYLDHFKDQDILDNYKSTRDIFNDIMNHEFFPNIISGNNIRVDYFLNGNLPNILVIDLKRFRNVQRKNKKLHIYL